MALSHWEAQTHSGSPKAVQPRAGFLLRPPLTPMVRAADHAENSPPPP